jgi:hypothetical protein
LIRKGFSVVLRPLYHRTAEFPDATRNSVAISERLHEEDLGMKRSTKFLIVGAGYGAALLIAWAAVALYVVATAGPDRQNSAGMFAFGDSIFFLAVFGIAAVPATCAALFFLRPVRAFWQIAAVGSLVIAATAIVVLLDYLLPRGSGGASLLGTISIFSPIRVLLAPLFGLAFFVSLFFAPTRSSRAALLGATLIEAGVFIWVVAAVWLQMFR